MNEISTEDLQQLTSCEYLLVQYNYLRKDYEIWINLEEDNKIFLTKENFIKSIKSIFPKISIINLLELTNRGSIVFVNKDNFKEVKSKNQNMNPMLPKINDFSNIKLKNSIHLIDF